MTIQPWGQDTPKSFWWGCAARTLKPIPYFRLKSVIFHTLFQTKISAVILI